MKKLRCAIYTRKSTEEGLEQEFNSLDAQREACAAYVKSQQHEGWTLTRGSYEDGGFSGGSMERPGLRQLLEEVKAGKIDVIVVYKVDRLTRSLADFAKIVEVLDARGASFVSVTQAFNTTTSMGRLTLNVLLSFAQFEREVTSERIRDKIAASKKKGLWMGGPVPLGYRVEDRKLVVVEEEAERVRHIMRRYLESSSANELIAQLNAEGVVTKVQQRASGPSRGGIPFARGSLFHLLKNRIYRGMIVHKGEAYPGEHEPIVGEELWEAVQAKLREKGPRRSSPSNARHRALLRGLLHDQHGRPMQLTFTKKGSRQYRYYASSREHGDERPAVRIGVDALERHALAMLRSLLSDEQRVLAAHAELPAEALMQILQHARTMLQRMEGNERPTLISELVERAIFDGRDLQLDVKREAFAEEASGTFPIIEPVTRRRWSREPRIAIGAETVDDDNVDRKLIALLAEAAAAQKIAYKHPDETMSELAARMQASRRQMTRLLRLSFLSPRIVEQMLAGKALAKLNPSELANLELPLSWREQEAQITLR